MRTLYAGCRVPSTSSDGYALLVLMTSLTVMLIALAAALPSVYHESQREKEEELIFRGNEYARAVYLFQRQFQRYPKSVDELIRTNNMRFLRHAYKDPMTPKGKWRFIHVGPNGVLIDSITMGPQAQPQLVGALGQSPGGASQLSPISGGSSEDQQASREAQKEANKRTVRAGCEAGKSESAFFSDNQVQGLLIAGVASCNEKNSIRVWNKKTKYEEWEFLGTAFQAAGFPGMPQQPQQGPGGQPIQPGQGSATGTSTFGTPGGQPMQPSQGGQTPGSSFGSGGTGPMPPNVQQPPDMPLTDQPAPEAPQEPEETPDTDNPMPR